MPLVAPVTVPLSTTPLQRLEMLETEARAAAVEPRVIELARRARALGDPAAVLLRTVQDLVPFVLDPPGVERIQPVLWTIAHGGDCANVSSTLRALYLAASVRSRLVWCDLQRQGYPYNHVTVQITHDASSVPETLATWLWAEPSVRGAQLGEHPLAAAAREREWRPFSG